MSRAGIVTAQLNCADIIAQVGFFTGLAAGQFERVAAIGRIEEYPQDSRIYAIGEAATDFYVLVDGMVRFTIGLGQRQTYAGQVLRRGEVFGWAALIEGAQKRIATALCITPCTVLAINGDQLTMLMDQDHGLGYHIARRLTVLITGNLTAFASG